MRGLQTHYDVRILEMQVMHARAAMSPVATLGYSVFFFVVQQSIRLLRDAMFACAVPPSWQTLHSHQVADARRFSTQHERGRSFNCLKGQDTLVGELLGPRNMIQYVLRNQSELRTNQESTYDSKAGRRPHLKWKRKHQHNIPKVCAGTSGRL